MPNHFLTLTCDMSKPFVIPEISPVSENSKTSANTGDLIDLSPSDGIELPTSKTSKPGRSLSNVSDIEVSL
ncbi:hypothetical protein DASC09_004780 [Saccharomycopsis crataegensis]|uniref:Uncharacterized protein n=1 Tax=Saccharomycopsis crataegensis TaxID=43959 RepID=A0AAV5QE91_9ASCO|nr:hypothetical protein DASC09_004780 [Saccharomycopsis crataegensis]